MSFHIRFTLGHGPALASRRLTLRPPRLLERTHVSCLCMQVCLISGISGKQRSQYRISGRRNDIGSHILPTLRPRSIALVLVFPCTADRAAFALPAASTPRSDDFAIEARRIHADVHISASLTPSRQTQHQLNTDLGISAHITYKVFNC